MNDSQWQTFFDILHRIVSEPNGSTWKERAAEVEAKAREFDGESNLEEFIAWFPEPEGDN